MPFLAVLRTGALGLLALATAGSAVSQIQAGQRKVDLELVLAVDISRSMDYDEHALQRDGYVEAFRHKDVINALMSGPRDASPSPTWNGQARVRPIRSSPGPSSTSSNAAHAFADRLAEEQIRGERRTSISTALFAAADLIERNDIVAHRPRDRCLGRRRQQCRAAGRGGARLRARRRDITINGLPILLNKPAAASATAMTSSTSTATTSIASSAATGAFIAPVYRPEASGGDDPEEAGDGDRQPRCRSGSGGDPVCRSCASD